MQYVLQCALCIVSCSVQCAVCIVLYSVQCAALCVVVCTVCSKVCKVDFARNLAWEGENDELRNGRTRPCQGCNL